MAEAEAGTLTPRDEAECSAAAGRPVTWCAERLLIGGHHQYAVPPDGWTDTWQMAGRRTEPATASTPPQHGTSTAQSTAGAKYGVHFGRVPIRTLRARRAIESTDSTT